MSNYDFTPISTQTITSDEQIRAYVNPTRMSILSMLVQEKNSVSGIARQLGVHPANLTHHFKLLEKVGLIELVEKRETGKNLEKLYRATAYHFTVQASDQPTDQQVLALSILRDNLTAALQSRKSQADERPVLGALKTVRLKPEDIEKFAQKLIEIANEFEAHAAETGDVYSLNVSLYPTEAGHAPAREIVIGMDEGSAG
jgi:DNA-binding transcriptional ArsR family regulator